MPEVFSALRRHGLSRDLWDLAVSLSKNDRLDLVFALVGDTPLEYQPTPVRVSSCHSSQSIQVRLILCSKEVGHARVNPFSI